MSLTPTDEQSAIIHWQGQKLVVNAFAGTGKTSTLVQYALANPDSRMLYLAYNRSVRDEAERKFPFNVECKTSHQLAWSRFGKHYQKRLVASLSGRKVYWVGGIEGYRTEALEDLYWFSADMPEKMQSDALRRDYRDFDEYCRIAKSTRDVEMNQAIRLLDICFPLPVKLKLLREHTVTSEKDADITVSTAHRSKGLEWPVVILDEDFADITDPLMPEDERRDETNLLYVAVTRARKTLVVNSLMRQLAEEAGRDEQNQKAAEASPSEDGENDAVYGQEGENA